MFHFAVVPLLSADGVGLGDGRHIQGERAVPKRKRVAQADNITWPRRNVGRGPLGGAATSASPDNDRMPKSTPGSTGLCDETAIDLSEFGLNPFNLSNKFELHVLKREFVALPSGANLESNAFIFEYDGTKGQYYGSQELTYPHGDKQRNFYQIGDVIMIAAYSVALVERRLPQVAALFRTNDWFLMAASALGLKITLGWRIRVLSVTSVFCTLVLLVGDDLVFDVEDVSTEATIKRTTFSTGLEDSFRSVRGLPKGWAFIKKVAPIVVDIGTGAVSGVGRAAIRRIAVKLTSRRLREKAGKILVLRLIGQVDVDFKQPVADFIKAAATKYVEFQLQPKGMVPDDTKLRLVVAVGAAAFVNSLISAAGSAATKALPDATSFKDWLANRLADQLIKLMPNATTMLIGAHTEAYEKAKLANAGVGSDKYRSELAKALDAKWAGPLKSVAKNLLLSTGGLDADP